MAGIARNVLPCILMVVVFSAAYPYQAEAEVLDTYLREVYDLLHESPLQRYYRQLAPMPAGVVYIQRPGEEEPEIRWHFKTMKRLGFSALKQVLLVPGQDEKRVAEIAIEEGLCPWWYGEAGWEPISPELLGRLGMDASLGVAEARDDPRMIAYQQEVLRKRSRVVGCESGAGERGSLDELEEYFFDKTTQPRLPAFAKEAFVGWARDTYGSLEQVSHAHNRHHAGFGDAYQSWEEVGLATQHKKSRDLSRIRDEFRFRADGRIDLLRAMTDPSRSADPFIPFRQGGEIGLFMSMPLRGVDLEAVADLMTERGCFYPSIHLEWHFDQVNYEITRPVYMHASLATDLFKGGWAFGVETTGGPQQHSGAGEPFTVDDGVMTQLMLSYLAGGFRGFGIWAWSSRSAGLEGGEYALLGRNNEITPRARQAGRIGSAARKYRDELWDARKEPLVGVFYDWDSEAYWATLGVRSRPDFAFRGIEARIGISRALINANVPFEYVTATDLRKGLANRYRVIYLPAIIALSDDLWPIFRDYVASGGRLVLDMPGAHMNTRGALIPTGEGSAFESLFGVVLRDHQGAGINRHYEVEGIAVKGYVADLHRTKAGVVAEFQNGSCAATEHRVESGSAVLLGYAASHACFRPGAEAAEQQLLRYTMGSIQPSFSCDGAIVYRLSSSVADHYFLINDGDATTVALLTDCNYPSWSDAVTGEKLLDTFQIDLPSHSGRWLRACKFAE